MELLFLYLFVLYVLTGYVIASTMPDNSKTVYYVFIAIQVVLFVVVVVVKGVF